MESYNPNESMIPAVGGNITPMSGGGVQEGGAGTTLFGLRLEEFTKHMREAFTKIDKTNTYTSSITEKEEASLTTKLYTKVLNGEIKSKLKITSSEGGGIVTGEKGAIQKFVAYLQENLKNNKEMTGDIKIQNDKLILTLEIPVTDVEPAAASGSASDAAKPAGSTASDAAKPASASGSAKSATAPAPPASAPPATAPPPAPPPAPPAPAPAPASASASGSTPAPPASGSAKSATATATATASGASGASASGSTDVPVNQTATATATAKAKGP
jgi:hypothetical protein